MSPHSRQTRSRGSPLFAEARQSDLFTLSGHLVADLYIDTVDAGGHV